MVRAGTGVREGTTARLRSCGLRARGDGPRHPEAVRRLPHPRSHLPASRRAIRAAGRARQGARLLRSVPGPVEGRGPGATAFGTGRATTVGNTDTGNGKRETGKVTEHQPHSRVPFPVSR